jgi:hypothetical protein
VASPTPQRQPSSNGASHKQPPPPPPPNIAATQPPVMPTPAQQSIPQPSPAPPASYHQQPMPAIPQTPANIPRQMAVPANTGVVPTPPPRGRLDSFGTNGSYSPPAGSIGVGRRSETPHSQAMSPPAMLPPAQRMSATPRPPSFSPVPAAARAVPHPAPTSAPQLYVQPAYQQYQEPTIRAEGKGENKSA